MSGLTGLIDALLAVKASPRVDVLAIKAEAQIGAPGAVAQVLKVDNDVRLPSKAALDRLLPGAASSLPAAAAASSQQPEAELSVAARVISAVLANLEADPGPVRGTAPAWPARQAPSAPALAGALAQTVAHSGLFYESHLLEFASGTRPLAQMMQEPQARWATPLAAQRVAEAIAAAPAESDGAPGPALPEAAGAAAALAVPSRQPESMLGARSAVPEAVATTATQADAPDADAPAGAVPSAGRAPHDAAAGAPPDAARLQAAYAGGEAARAVPSPDAAISGRPEDIDAQRHAASAVRAAPTTEVIHPQAVALVHQQLDLLATAVFRWTGEAWPGVAMNWSVEKEATDTPTDESAEGSVDDTPQRWSTTVSMSLPRLGQVDLRLSLAGPGVHARLAAIEPSTATVLRAEGRSLVQRMAAAGLQLQDLQVATINEATAGRATA